MARLLYLPKNKVKVATYEFTYLFFLLKIVVMDEKALTIKLELQ